MTVIDAYQHDLAVVVPLECVAGRDPRHHDITLEYLGEEIAAVVPLSALLP